MRLRILLPPRIAPGLIVALAAASLLGACSERTFTGITDDGGEKPELPKEPGRWSIETFVTPKRVVAGSEVTVNCVVSQDRAYLLGVPTVVAITPSPGALTTSPTGVRFTPTQAGQYNVRCQTADQSIADVDGVTVIVDKAPPASVETVIGTIVAEASAPVAVSCELLDAYGNELEPNPVQGFFQVITGAALWQDPPSGTGFVVRGTVAGDHTVACSYAGLTDPTPEVLTIIPGIPANTETFVDTTDLGPTEPSGVSCAVTDQWGNVLDGYDTTVLVLAEDGTPPETNGLSLNGRNVSATLAGTYYVACAVEGYFAADESPAVVSVHPGPPHSWIVELPEQECFWQNRRLPLLFVVYDAWGNEIPEEDYTLFVSSSPQGAVLVDDTVHIPDEGDFTIFVDLASTVIEDPNSTITPQSFAVRVDSTPPVINITSPSRANMLLQGTASVSITGTVADGISALESVEINGTSSTLAPGVTTIPISTSMSSQWGLNVITGSAVDECGNRRVMAQSFLRSSAYFDPATAVSASARVPSGLLARLNQPVIDDYNRADLDDLASIGEAVLLAQNFNTLLPAGTVLASDGLRSTSDCDFCDWWGDTAYEVRRHSNANNLLAWAGPWIIYLNAIDNGLSLSVRLENFDFPLQAKGWLRECACGIDATQTLPSGSSYLSGWAGADVVTATGSLGISASGSNINVNVNSLSLNTTGLYLDMDCGWADFLCDAIADIVVPLLADTIEDALAGVIGGQIPGLIDGFLSAFALDTGFTLPPPLNMTLNLSSGLDFIDFDGPAGSGNGELGLYTQIYPSSRGTSIPSNSRGAVRRDGTAPTFSSTQYSFGLTLKDDLLNQALWAVWYGGGLNLNLTEILALTGGGIDLSGVSMTLDAKLPPVIMPGSGQNQTYIGLGDTYVQATVDLAQLLGAEASTAPPLNVGLYLSARVGAYLDIDPTTNEIQIAMDPNPGIYVEVIQIDDEGYQGVMTDLFAGVLRLLVPRLLASVLGSIPIPEFDLGGLGVPLSAGNAVLSLTNGELGRPNTANSCLSGTERLDATHFCLTGSLQ